MEGLTIGQRHQLRVDVSANPFDPAAQPKDKRLIAANAGSLSQLVRLRRLLNDEYGVVTDNVRSSAVPELTTRLMLCAGIGLVGLSLRSRKSMANVSA